MAILFNIPTTKKIIEGAAEAIKSASDRGWTIAGITNQGGVFAGYKTMHECIQEQVYTLELLPQLNSIFFCPDNGGTCYRVIPGRDNPDKYYAEGFRKPQPGMIILAQQILVPKDDDLSIIYYVGDRDEDEQAAIAANVNKFIWALVWREKYKELIND